MLTVKNYFRTMTAGEAAVGMALLFFLAIGFWAVLMAARVVPAMPWSPLGQTEQHQVTPVNQRDPFGLLDDYMRQHHLRPSSPGQAPAAPEGQTTSTRLEA